MNITVTKEQYQTLLKTLKIAEWVLSSAEQDAEEETFREEFEKFDQYILSQYKEFDAKDSVFFDSELNMHFVTQEVESSIIPFVEHYEEYIFWDELNFRLARRDLILDKGEDEVYTMDPLERMNFEEEYLVKYSQEFETHGVSRLRITE